MLTFVNNIVLYCGYGIIFISLLNLVFRIFSGIRIHIFSKCFTSQNLTTRFGKWAVVTGCTDGIGLAYTRELARRGLNVVLISRSMDKLQAVATDIERDFGVSTHIVQADFSKEGRELYQRIKLQLKNIEIGILVNNVGVIPPYPMLVEEMTEQMIWDHMTCNVTAATMMTSLVLKDMKSRRKGAIVNLCSIAGRKPVPYLAVYGASKAYVEHLSHGLHAECRNSGVTIQTLTPSYVNTKMVGYSPQLTAGGIMVPSADTYARHAVSTLGVADVTTGYLPHGIQYWFSCLSPDWLNEEVVLRLNKHFRKQYDKLHAN